jgi:SPP1 gp7 family putative phage head morphogenesis protein
VKSVSKVALDAKEAERAAELASDEYDLTRYVSKIILADKGREMLRYISKAIRTGEIPARFDRAERYQELVTTGLDQYDPRIAFQASLRTAYAAGREQRIDDDPEMTHKVYRTMRDSRVRDSHRILDGVCLPKDDAFWDTHSAPNGWRCRCKCYGVDEEAIQRLKARGVKLQEEAPEEPMVTHVNKATGEKETLPASVEPGWGFRPGSKGSAEQLQKMLARRMLILAEGED